MHGHRQRQRVRVAPGPVRSPEQRAAEAVRAPGEPLPAPLQSEAAQRYGHSFSRVRVHTAQEAGAAASGLHAAAYTIGDDIAFAPQRYAPATAQGRALLEHELHHVAQQRGASSVAHPVRDAAGSAHEGQAREALVAPVTPLAEQRIQCAPEEEGEYSIGTGIADSIGRHVFEEKWPFIKAVLEGFVGGMKKDVQAGRADAAKSHLKKLLIPTNAAKFYLGYLVGLVLGLISPVTDLITGVVGLAKLGASAVEWLAKWSPVGVAISPERQAKILRLGEKFAGLGEQLGNSLSEFVKDPKGTAKKLAAFFDNLMQMALGKAREFGAQGAHAIFDFLEQDFYPMGEGIGKVIGTLIAQVLMLVFTAEIGNLISKGASFAGKLAEAVAGKAVELFNWGKALFSEMGAVLRRAVKGALKAFEGLVNKVIEAFEAVVELFTEGAALDAGAERAAAGAGRAPAGPLANTMESRMVKTTRETQTTVAQLKTPKVHPSNVGKEAQAAKPKPKAEPPEVKPKEGSTGQKVSPAAKDAAALQYRENLVKRYPKLQEAELQPIKRNLGEPGLWEESAYTGSGERSWSAKLRDGSRIQLDDIDRSGVVVDTKMRGLRSGLEIPPEHQPDVVSHFGGASQPRKFDVFPPNEQDKLLRQLRFARENGLNGVRWETNDAALLSDVNRYRATMLSDAEQKIFRIVLVQR
jgi:hypothetical protein